MATRGRTDYGSADDAYAVTPNDAADIAIETRQLVVAADGNVQVTMARSGAVVVVFFAAGVPISLRVSRVWATNTTATGIVAIV